MTDFTYVKEDDIAVFFVNTSVSPDEVAPLHSYKFEGNILYRLYYITYIHNSMRYSLYQWRQVEVKIGCKDAVHHLYNASIGIQEFIV